MWEKKARKNKINLSDEQLSKIVHKLKYKDTGHFYHTIAQDESKVAEVIDILTDKNKLQAFEHKGAVIEDAFKPEEHSAEFSKFISDAKATINGAKPGTGTIQNISGIQYDLANCCDPVPGDDVLGFISNEKGISIHRKTCKNIVNLFLKEPEKILQINWNQTDLGEFTSCIKIIGEDKSGILNEITKTISKNFNSNIKSVDIKTKNSMFEGILILSIQNLKQLNLIIEKINKLEGIFSVTRFEL